MTHSRESWKRWISPKRAVFISSYTGEKHNYWNRINICPERFENMWLKKS